MVMRMKEMSFFRRCRARRVQALLLLAGLLLANVLFVWLRWRVDCTAEERFSLSRAMCATLETLERPVEVTLYWSRQVPGIPPSLQSHGAYVASMLEEYAHRSEGKLRLRVLEPAPGSAAEQQALEDGVVFEELRAGEAGSRYCLGVSFKQLGRPDVSLPQLLPEARNCLEYEVVKALERLRGDRTTVVGVLSALPLFGGVDVARQRQLPEWGMLGALREANCDVRALEVSGTGDLEVPAEVEVLLLVQPPELSEAGLRALDAFIQRGGRLLAYLDAACWTQMRQRSDAAERGICSSSLPQLLSRWGVTFAQQQTVLDRRLATIVLNRRGVPENHLEWLTLGGEQLNSEDAVTRFLQHVEMFYAGSFTWQPCAGVQVTPLLTSTSEAQLVETSQAFRHQSLLERDYRAGGQPQVLAVRVEGRLPSAFSADAVSVETRCILLGDADGLQDTFVGKRKTDNLQLLLNCVDSLRPDGEALMALRNRSFVMRRLTKLDERTEASKREFQERLKVAQAERERLQAELKGLEEHREQTLSDAEGVRVREIHGRLLAAERALRALQVASLQSQERYRQRVILLNFVVGPGLLLLLLAIVRVQMRLRAGERPSRRFLVVSLVGVVLAVLVLWGVSSVAPDEQAATAVVSGGVQRERLLSADIKRDSLSQIRFRGHGGDVTLVRGTDGLWGVQECAGFPASVSLLNQLVESLGVCAGVRQELSADELSAVGLSPAVNELELVQADGTASVVRFGAWRRNYRGEPRGRYVQGTEHVLLTEYLFRQVGISATSWLERTLPGWTAEAKRLTRISEFKEFSWSLERRSGGYEVLGRVPRGQAVSAPVVQNMVDSFRRLAVLSAERDVPGFQQEVALQIIGEDDIVFDYVLGRSGERWYARLTGARSASNPERAELVAKRYDGYYLEVDGRLCLAFRRTRLELFKSVARGRS